MGLGVAFNDSGISRSNLPEARYDSRVPIRCALAPATNVMSDKSKIEWTDATWNPVRGCTKISPGCAHCYAETFAERFRGVPGSPFEQGFDLRLVPEKLTQPFEFAQPRLVFVNIMSDLFHETVPDEYIEQVARVMAASPWHTYQILTKRPTRMCDLLRDRLQFAARLRHIWWGVGVDDRRFGLPRVDQLLESDAAVKFLSVEPLLEHSKPLTSSIGPTSLGSFVPPQLPPPSTGSMAGQRRTPGRGVMPRRFVKDPDAMATAVERDPEGGTRTDSGARLLCEVPRLREGRQIHWRRAKW